MKNISYGLNMEVTQYHIDELKKICKENGFRQTASGAISMLGEDVVINNLPYSFRLFLGRVAMHLG